MYIFFVSDCAFDFAADVISDLNFNIYVSNKLTDIEEKVKTIPTFNKLGGRVNKNKTEIYFSKEWGYGNVTIPKESFVDIYKDGLLMSEEDFEYIIIDNLIEGIRFKRQLLMDASINIRYYI